MFDIGPSELLLIVIVAVVVIGPKDLPLALRTAGRWIGKMRKISGHFRSGLDTMIREAEMADMEQKWREQNARIMAEHPAGTPPETEPTGAWPASGPGTDPAIITTAGEPQGDTPPAASAESRLAPDPYAEAPQLKPASSPETGEEGKA